MLDNTWELKLIIVKDMGSLKGRDKAHKLTQREMVVAYPICFSASLRGLVVPTCANHTKQWHLGRVTWGAHESRQAHAHSQAAEMAYAVQGQTTTEARRSPVLDSFQQWIHGACICADVSHPGHHVQFLSRWWYRIC